RSLRMTTAVSGGNCLSFLLLLPMITLYPDHAMNLQSPDIRNVLCDGVKTTISVDDITWYWLRCIAVARGLSLSKLVGEINRTMRLLPARKGKRRVRSLSSAVRVFVLENAPFKDEIS